MRFILKDGLVHIVENNGFYNNTIEAIVETPDLEGFRVDYKINSGEYTEAKDGLVVIPREVLKTTKLDLTFRASLGNITHYFKSDTIPFTQATLFGGTIEDFYPQAIIDLQNKVESLHSTIRNTTRELDKDLKGTMRELVHTFEDITKKGSLF